MSARKNRGVGSLPDSWKDNIRAGVIMQRLEKCAHGELDMTAQQLKAAEIILKKTIPDLNRTDLNHSGELTQNINWPLPKSKLDD